MPQHAKCIYEIFKQNPNDPLAFVNLLQMTNGKHKFQIFETTQ